MNELRMYCCCMCGMPKRGIPCFSESYYKYASDVELTYVHFCEPCYLEYLKDEK